MSIKLPAGHGPAALPLKARAHFKNNLPIVIREGLANAITFGAKNCHVVRLKLPNGDLYLCIMHDGKPFQGGVTEIKQLGLTPNHSSNEGWSFQGNGLTYCASYLAGVHPKLVIASKKDGDLSVASATINHLRNDWLINDEPNWEQQLKQILGDKWYNAMNVFYLFLLPESEKEEKDGYSMKYNNNLTFLAPGMVQKVHVEGGPPKMTISESIFWQGKVANNGTEYQSLSDCQRTGSWGRNLVSPEEFALRFCEKQWSFETEPFTLKRDGWEYGARAEITILGCPGVRSETVSGQDNRQWMANIRDGFWNERPFKKGRGVGMGVKPNHAVYLYAPVISNGHDSDEKMFSRFKDNAVGFTWLSQNFYAALGLPYRDNLRKKKTEDKPFAVMQVRITHLDNEMRFAQSGETQTVSPIYFANAFGRRADFLFDTSASIDILNSVMNAGCDNVPVDCRKWFVEHFPVNEEDRVPITFGQREVVTESDEYAVYDLASGDKFSKVFHAGHAHILAIWSRRLKKFVTDAKESSITRGVTVRRMPHEAMEMASEDIRLGYTTLHKSCVAKSHIEEEGQIPFFNVSIDGLAHLEEDGSWTPISTFQYQHHNDDYRPSRGVHVTIDSSNLRLGHVEEVPPRPGRGDIPKRQKQGLGGTGFKQRNPYCERDHRIAVEWDEKNKSLRLNINNPTFGLLYNVPDEVGSKSQTVLEDLYFTLRSIAFGAAIGVAEPTKADHSPVTSAILDDDGNPIYHDNRWDYVVNRAIEQFMADSPYVQNILRTVEEHRSRKIA